MKKDYLLITTITCPFCQIKQTGFIKNYDLKTGIVKELPEIGIVAGFAIKYAWSKCAQLITGDQLYETAGVIIDHQSKT